MNVWEKLQPEIKRLLDQGVGWREIRAKLGCANTTISLAVKHMGGGYKKPKRTRKPPAWSAQTKMREMLLAGHTVSQVCQACDRNRRTVNKMRRELGLPVDNPVHRPPWAPAMIPAPPSAKFESTEEFLARGGKIKKCPSPWTAGRIAAMAAPVPYADHTWNKFQRNRSKRAHVIAKKGRNLL